MLLAALIASTSLHAARTSQEPPQLEADDLSEADFEMLVEKTNLYVRALNAVAGVRRSHERYTSWVDVKKGFTGKERYISYGLYELNSSTVDDIRRAAQKGPGMKPPLSDLDPIVVRLADAVVALQPLIKKAHDYFEQEDYKDDGAKLGQQLHAEMMPLFERVFAAETDLRDRLDAIKVELDQRQLAEIEKASGRNYQWHLRSFMIAAKRVVTLLPDGPQAPMMNARDYRAEYDGLEKAYNAWQTFAAEHPEEVRKVIMSSMVDSAVKEFFTAAKFLRRTLEGGNVNRREYVEQITQVARTYNDLIQRTNSL